MPCFDFRELLVHLEYHVALDACGFGGAALCFIVAGVFYSFQAIMKRLNPLELQFIFDLVLFFRPTNKQTEKQYQNKTNVACTSLDAALLYGSPKFR